MRLGRIYLVLAIVIATGCIASQDRISYRSPAASGAVTPTPTTQVPTNTTVVSTSSVTFSGKVLPLLNDTRYRCTTCHSTFTDAAVVRSRINLIIEYVQISDTSSPKYMPRGMTRLDAASLQILKEWQANGSP